MTPITPFDNWCHQCHSMYGYLVPYDDVYPEAFSWYCDGKTPKQYVQFATDKAGYYRRRAKYLRQAVAKAAAKRTAWIGQLGH